MRHITLWARRPFRVYLFLIVLLPGVWWSVSVSRTAVGQPHTTLPDDAAVTLQMNAAHTGAITSPGLVLPFKQTWVRDFGESLSYPVIAEGKVFILTNPASSNNTTQLYALNGATGAVLWGPIDA